jgi:hypothetical protein
MGDAIGFQCCFCGKTVARAGPDPFVLVIPLPDGGSEELRCHRACLQRVLHPSVPLGVVCDNEAAGADPVVGSDGR